MPQLGLKPYGMYQSRWEKKPSEQLKIKGGSMSMSFSRSVRNIGLLGAFVVAPCLAMINPGSVSAAEQIKAQLGPAPTVPPPITRREPANVLVELEAVEHVGKLSDDNNYKFWSINGTVPGPLIRVMVGDTV